MPRSARTAIAVVVWIALALGLAGGVIALGLRRRWPFVLDGMRRLSGRFINPRQLVTAGQPGAYASVIEHRGRRSGRHYRTPVVAWPLDDGGFVVSLTYGDRADWTKNVLAAGSATLVHEGESNESLVPEVLALDRVGPWIAESEQRMLRRFGVETCLLLHPGPGAGQTGC